MPDPPHIAIPRGNKQTLAIRRGPLSVRIEPLDMIAAGAVLVAIILALAVAFGSLQWNAGLTTVFLGLVGSGAVMAYKGQGKRKQRKAAAAKLSADA